MTKEEIIDHLLWMACWLEQPPPVPDGRCYDIAQACRLAVEIIKESEEEDDE